MATATMMDYYSELGVSKTATEKELKAAFRKLARKHHPDANRNDPSAEDRFKRINEAYEVLSDPQTRKLYDRYGDQWRQYRDAGFTGDEPQGATPGGFTYRSSPTSSARPGSQYTTYTFEPEDADAGFGDLFGSLFGRRGAEGRFESVQTRPRKGEDLEAALEISFQEAFTGTKRRFEIESPEICATCNGTGLARGATCPTCDGRGTVSRRRMLEVDIPAGVASGHRIRLAGQGGAGRSGGPAGDVYLRVTVREDPRFEREGETLRTTIDVDAVDAVLGAEAIVPTPSGRVALTIPAMTQSGKVFRLRNQGMPSLKRPGTRGDLFAKVNIVIPTTVSERERELFEEIRRLRRA